MPNETDWRTEGIVRYNTDTPLREHRELALALHNLQRRREAMLTYRNECARIADHHGVQDASSDLRELDAAEAALRWVLGERETLGY